MSKFSPDEIDAMAKERDAAIEEFVNALATAHERLLARTVRAPLPLKIATLLAATRSIAQLLAISTRIAEKIESEQPALGPAIREQLRKARESIKGATDYVDKAWKEAGGG